MSMTYIGLILKYFLYATDHFLTPFCTENKEPYKKLSSKISKRVDTC